MISYIIMSVGTVIWVYGYFTTGSPSLFDWKAHTPSWIAEFLPNLAWGGRVGHQCACWEVTPLPAILHFFTPL
jgi:hypothetical protein